MSLRKKIMRTIEIEHKENGRNYVGDECDEKIYDTLSEQKVPE